MCFSELKIYHIDTGVLGNLAIKDLSSCKLDLYLKSQNAAILLTDILMFEILKNTDARQIKQILKLLTATANKVFLSTELISLHWLELADYYERGRPKTPSEFKEEYMHYFANETDWINYINIMESYTVEIFKENDQWIHDWVFGKMVSKLSQERNRKPRIVKDILKENGTYTTHLDLSSYHQFIDKKIDKNNYTKYENDILDTIQNGGISQIKDNIIDWIEKSMLPFEVAINLTDKELNDRVFYAEQLENASDYLTDKECRENFIKTMLPKYGQRVSKNKIIEEKMIELRQNSEVKVRRSDPFDILYLLLLPYIDLLSCDKNTHNEINQIIRKNSLIVNAQLQKNEDLYQCIMS